MTKEKINQQGFVLLTSMIVLILVSIAAISVSNRSKSLQQFAFSNARYEEITAIADAEIDQAITTLSNTKKKINVANKVDMTDESVTMVWNPRMLRDEFSRGGANRTDFSDFNDKGWDKAIKKYHTTSSGKIRTSLLIEEMVRRKIDESDDNAYISQYLITVMAVSIDDEVNAREKVVLQSVYQRSYGI